MRRFERCHISFDAVVFVLSLSDKCPRLLLRGQWAATSERVGIGEVLANLFGFLAFRPHAWAQAFLPSFVACVAAQAITPPFRSQFWWTAQDIAFPLMMLALAVAPLRREASNWVSDRPVDLLTMQRIQPLALCRAAVQVLMLACAIYAMVLLELFSLAFDFASFIVVTALHVAVAVITIFIGFGAVVLRHAVGGWLQPYLVAGRLVSRHLVPCCVYAVVVLVWYVILALASMSLVSGAILLLAGEPDPGAGGIGLGDERGINITPFFVLVSGFYFLAAATFLYARLLEIAYGSDFRGTEDVF